MESKTSILPVLCLALATLVICKPVDNKAGGSTNLIALGSIDGKTFFADPTKRSWAASKTFCSDMGMRLGIFTSKVQWDLLIAAVDAVDFEGDHWTAARDSQKSRQYTWDGLDTEPLASIGVWQSHGLSYQTCGSINPGGSHKAMHFETCITSHKVLCETIP